MVGAKAGNIRSLPPLCRSRMPLLRIRKWVRRAGSWRARGALVCNERF